MATVDKTWVFSADLEGFVDVGDSAISIVWDSTPQAGEILGAATGTAERFRTATSVNWETWGVPASSTVTDVQIISWDSRRWSNPVTTTITMRVVDSAGTIVHAAGDLQSVVLAVGTDGAFIPNGAGTSRAVDAGKQASTTDVRLEIGVSLSAASSSVDIGFDNVLLRITYTAGAATAAPAPRSFNAIPFIGGGL